MLTERRARKTISSARCRAHGVPRALSVLFLLIGMAAAATGIDIEQVEKNHQLQTIRTQIKDVESSIAKAQQDVDEYFRELKTNEVATAEIAARMHALEGQVSEKNQQLEKLAAQRNEQDALLKTQRDQLASQIRAAYKSGRGSYLKLLLNQQQPDRVGRVLAYYDYDVRARGRRIAAIHTALAEIALLEEAIQSETRKLLRLQQQQAARLAEYRDYRDSRRQITARLQAYIETQGSQLQVLQGNEAELSRLVDELKQEKLAIQIYEDMPPFNNLKGKLEWPVSGPITSSFGSLRKGGKLKWQGVTIAARSGHEVRAISTGKVVFADWFRNMGLLMILDHGDGYMSLYGHNESLLKKRGDWVLAGETITRVGDSGGQHGSGLYFEIRQAGNPVNPNLWCRK